jgi:hypothetical protein
VAEVLLRSQFAATEEAVMELDGEQGSKDRSKAEPEGAPFEAFASAVVFECLLGT